jgi:two-component system, NtrC family, sensor histidine kinase HydH
VFGTTRQSLPANELVAPLPAASYIRGIGPDTSVRAPAAGDTMRTSRIGRWARWGWLATTCALGAALLATSWMSHTRVVRAASTLNRGQAGVLFESARQLVRDLPSTPTDAELDSLLRTREDAGLRYVGLFDAAGQSIAQAGRPAVAGPLATSQLVFGPPSVTVAGSRIRLVASAPPPPGERDGDRRRDRRFLAVEFEPVVAQQMAAESMSTFILSALIAAGLLGAAIIFWRLSVQQELAERRFEEQRRLSALGEMAGVMAHEIRNPLASLKGHAQLLAERLGAGHPDRRKVERVVQEAERLEALTTDLLDFVRSGPMDVKPADPAALVSACADEVAPHGFALDTEGAPPSWPVDAARLRQAVTNVLRNALQATAAGTRPAVSVQERNGQLEITVRDFGAGIAAGDAEKIFTPFYTTRTTGTGLGLAVAQRVAQMHGGTIVAANDPGGGAVFRLAVPRS